MKVFLTGAAGKIGSAIIPELIKAGHQVLGLTRSDAGAASLLAAGAEVHRGSLEDLESLRSGAGKSDGVIHCAYDNNFANWDASQKQDERAIDALGDALIGSDRPLVITSVAAMGIASPGQLAMEEHYDRNDPHRSENNRKGRGCRCGSWRECVGRASSSGSQHGQAGPADISHSRGPGEESFGLRRGWFESVGGGASSRCCASLQACVGEA